MGRIPRPAVTTGGVPARRSILDVAGCSGRHGNCLRGIDAGSTLQGSKRSFAISRRASLLYGKGCWQSGNGVGVFRVPHCLLRTGHIGDAGPIFIAIAILFFAFTSIVGNYSYAESAMEFLGLGGKTPLMVLKLSALAMVVWGPIQKVATVFNFADATMAMINLVAIVILSKTVVTLTRDYFAQRKAGTEPQFHLADHPQLDPGIDHTIWTTDGATEQTNPSN